MTTTNLLVACLIVMGLLLVVAVVFWIESRAHVRELEEQIEDSYRPIKVIEEDERDVG